jgi:phosphatidylglycerophosphatase A
MKQKFVTFIATGMWSGLLRPFSGTWGTIPAWAIAFFLTGNNPQVHIVMTIALTLISVWSAGQAEEWLGQDAKSIVVDEWAGMFVTVLFVPVTLVNYLIAFVAFRFFDVVKLWPASQFERLPGGWGVTMDDIAAGVHACIIVHLYLWIMRTMVA